MACGRGMEAENRTGKETMLRQDLGDGLLMRQATWQDAEELARFNIRIHSDDPEDPELWLGEWTRDLLRGDHPTTGPEWVTVVVDQRAAGEIVSSAVLIPQTWRYEEVPFEVGRPELIGTDEQYRRRGLVRRQMEVAHARSEACGHMAQMITGIPHYYRRFGYEMALDLGGSRLFPYERLRKLTAKTTHDAKLSVRQATVEDIPLLDLLYSRHCSASMVSRIRDDKQWHYEMHGAHESSECRRRFRLIQDGDGELVGYFEFAGWPGRLVIREIASLSGCSMRNVALRAASYLRQYATREKAADDGVPALLFGLGVEHPAYQALARELVPNRQPYAWYVRVPRLRDFVTQIAPVLDRRLAQSVVAGYSGCLRLNCTMTKCQITWKEGMLTSIEDFKPDNFHDGDAFFPGHSFLQLLFGFRDLEQLRSAFPDCYTGNGETYVVLNALFPRMNSLPVGLG